MKVFRYFGLALLMLLPAAALLSTSSCGIYSLSGASIEGKTIRLATLENRARNVVPSLSPLLTDKLRNRIVSQTGLAPVNAPDADYDVTGVITAYELTVSGLQGSGSQSISQSVSQNRLTINIEISFKNRINPKADFKQTFSRFADFNSDKSLQQYEAGLIDEIGTQLADDVFNKAFVNW